MISLVILTTGLVVAGAHHACADTFVHSPTLSKFVQELRVPGPGGIPIAAPDRSVQFPDNTVADHYTLDINQFSDTLHPDLPATTLWGYNPTQALREIGTPTQKHLGGIFVVQRARPIQITFRNNLPNQHILPVDTTLMGADGAQNRTTVHLHGGFTTWLYDGAPFAWWDPQGDQGPSFLNNQVLRSGEMVPANEAEYFYGNNESARMQWYHDHAVGITRLNVYAGAVSAYIIRDAFEANVLVKQYGLPKFMENGGRELPLILQDKIFEPSDNPSFPGSARSTGDMWYPYIYDTDRWELGEGGDPLPPVSVVPESFGDTMLVNGTAFPKATVDPRRYRLRILNACQARYVNLMLFEDNRSGEPDFTKPGPDFLVIGAEGGFLARPVLVPSKPLIVDTDPMTGDRTVDPANPGGSLITGPAERWDVVVNFNGRGGKKYILCNDAPAPYPMGDSLNDYPNAMGQGDVQVLMRFEVREDGTNIPRDPLFRITPNTPLAGNSRSGINPPLAGKNPNTPTKYLNWNQVTAAPLPIPNRPGIVVRQLTLNENFDNYGRLIQMLGTDTATTDGDFSRTYADEMDPYSAPTETPAAGSTEVWQVVNLTGDVHPIHIHLTDAQLLSRQPFDVDTYMATQQNQKGTLVFTGPARGPDATELGWKETFKMNPGEVTTIIMKWDLPKVPFNVPVSPRTGGYEYVWHCHILDHEEHDMMRPLVIQP
ncbi:MAG: multicopper oxidase domain-containing protein [Candidatus Sumerlaeaceae bacterium]|nr:multicopper oxidase domain-containing protein [Candidatus Sumerlaeaceae bacterium]